jgi:hypothetical protein
VDWAQIGPGAIVAVIGFGGAWVTSKIQNKGRPENALIDQLQENMKTQDEKILRLENRQAQFEARDRVYIPHIIRLNMHIDQGLGPPAPKIPKVIQEFLDQQEGED